MDIIDINNPIVEIMSEWEACDDDDEEDPDCEYQYIYEDDDEDESGQAKGVEIKARL